MYRILVTDYVWPNLDPETEVLKRIDGQLVVAPNGEEATLVELARDCDAIMTCFAKVTPNVVRAATRCKVIARYGIGVDNIAVDVATERGIVVTNVPEYCIDEVSDHAMALLLAAARKVALYDRHVKAGTWDINVGKPIFRIRGRTLGLAGSGKIGRAIAAKAQAFGMRVIVYDPYLSDEAIRAIGARKVELEDLFRDSDFLSLHAPLTDETRHMVNERTLRLMKPTAVVINTARGALVDTAALARALQEGWIAGAGIDVQPQEPPPADDPLLRCENAILTPHAAFYSEESLVELQTKTAEEVVRVLSGRMPVSVVNKAVLQKVKLA